MLDSLYEKGRGELISVKSALAKKRGKCRGEKIRDETGRLLLVARNNNMRVSLGKLRNFSGGNDSET